MKFPNIFEFFRVWIGLPGSVEVEAVSKVARDTGAHECKLDEGENKMNLTSNHNESNEIEINIPRNDCRKGRFLHFICVRQERSEEMNQTSETSVRGPHMCDCRVKRTFNFSMEVVDGQWVHEGTRPIHFCNCCQRLVSASDLADGIATLADGKASCRQCKQQRQPLRISGVFSRHLSSVRHRFALPRRRHSLAWNVACGG